MEERRGLSRKRKIVRGKKEERRGEERKERERGKQVKETERKTYR